MSKVTIKRARVGFSRWRKARKGKEPVPTKLRLQALQILEQEGYRATCKALGVGPSQLAKWQRAEQDKVVKGQSSKKSKVRLQRDHNTGKEIKFVEITPRQIPCSSGVPAMSAGSGMVCIEWSRADGASMKVGGYLGTIELARLASLFLNERARAGI